MTNRPPPTETYRANGLQCANPLCRRPVGPRRVLRGSFLDQCQTCGQWYLVRAAMGVAEVNGLSDDQATRWADRFDESAEMVAEILTDIGVIRYRQCAS